MTTAISGNPSTSSWHHWQQKTDEKNNNATSHQPGTHQVSTHNREAGRSRQERSQASSHLTQHKYNAAPQTPNPTDTASAPPYKPGEFISTGLTSVPRAPSEAPVTKEYDNGNVKITSSPLHQGAFNGVPTTRNKVTIETGNQDDHVEIKTLQSGGVVAEINGKAYELPIENVGGKTELLEVKTNGGKDQVNVADNIWFETTISLNDDHHVSGMNGYTSAPESSGKKTFSESDAIPAEYPIQPEGDSRVFQKGDVTITYNQNKSSNHPGDGVTIIKTGDDPDAVRIMAAEDGSLAAEINGETFLLPVKNDATGRSRLFIATQGGEDKIVIDSNVKNYAFILPGEDKNGSLHSGGGFVSGAEEPRLAQRYRAQNYNTAPQNV